MEAEPIVQDLMQPPSAVVSWLDTAEAALGRMLELGLDRLPVTDAHGVIGLCERSMLQVAQRRGNWLGGISVGDLMRHGPFWCRQTEARGAVLKTMERLHTDVLAVIDRRGRVVGTVHRDRMGDVAAKLH